MVHTCAHTHTHTHTYTHAYTYTYTYTHTRTRTHMHTHNMYKRTHAHTHNMYTHTYMHTHVYMYIRIHTHTHARTRTQDPVLLQRMQADRPAYGRARANSIAPKTHGDIAGKLLLRKGAETIQILKVRCCNLITLELYFVLIIQGMYRVGIPYLF